MAATLKTWASKATHSITLPSSAEVEIRIPDLVQLLEAGEVPNELIPIAMGTAQAARTGTEMDIEDVKKYGAFVRFLLAKTVVSPKIEPADVDSLPTVDKDMLLEFATRKRDVDALQHHIGGLHLQEDWQRFRRQLLGYEDGPDLEGVG